MRVQVGKSGRPRSSLVLAGTRHLDVLGLGCSREPLVDVDGDEADVREAISSQHHPATSRETKRMSRNHSQLECDLEDPEGGKLADSRIGVGGEDLNDAVDGDNEEADGWDEEVPRAPGVESEAKVRLDDCQPGDTDNGERDDSRCATEINHGGKIGTVRERRGDQGGPGDGGADGGEQPKVHEAERLSVRVYSPRCKGWAGRTKRDA